MTFHVEIVLAGRKVGPGRPVFVIAEAGVSHFGSLEKAFRLVDLAADAGADAVKFQVFRTEDLLAPAAGQWRERLRAKELPFGAFREIRDRCVRRGIPFCATAHDEPSLEFLGTLDVPFYKVGSGEVTNWPFLERVAHKGRPVILSTGMYTLSQVGEALTVLERAANRDVCVLHCTTAYPTPPAEVNLKAIDTIRETYGVLVGYSDHTRGFHVPLAAVARGASVLEKHITLDFDVPDAQDWKVSCGPEDFPRMMRELRELEAALGTGAKEPGPSELRSLDWARKSLVAAADIAAGQLLTREMIAAKRPGTGIPPSQIGDLVGRRARQAIAKDTPLAWDLLA